MPIFRHLTLPFIPRPALRQRLIQTGAGTGMLLLALVAMPLRGVEPEVLLKESAEMLAQGRVGIAITKAEDALRMAEFRNDWRGRVAGLAALASARMSAVSLTPRELNAGEQLLLQGLDILKDHPEVEARWVAELHGKLAWVKMHTGHRLQAATHLLLSVHASLEHPEMLKAQWDQCRGFITICEYSTRPQDEALVEPFLKDLLLTVQVATGLQDVRMIAPMDLWAEHLESLKARNVEAAAGVRAAVLDIMRKHGVKDERFSAECVALAELQSLHLQQPQEAKKNYQAALEIEQALPVKGKRLARIHDGMARVARANLDKPAEYIALAEKAWQVWREVGTLEDAGCRAAQDRLAALLLESGKAERGEQLYAELLAWQRTTPAGSSNPEARQARMKEEETLLQDLCRVYAETMKRPEQALERCRELLALQSRMQGNLAARVKTLSTYANLLKTLDRMGQDHGELATAMGELEQKIVTPGSALDPVLGESLAKLHLQIARALDTPKATPDALDAALPHLISASEIRRDVLRTAAADTDASPGGKVEIIRTLAEVARLHERRHDPAAAEEWYRRALAFAGNSASNPGWMETARALAVFLSSQHRHSEAVAVLRRMLDALGNEDSELLPLRRSTMHLLFRELENAGDDEGALLILGQIHQAAFKTSWQVEDQEYATIREARIKVRTNRLEAGWEQMRSLLEIRRLRKDEGGVQELLQELIPVGLARQDTDAAQAVITERLTALEKQGAKDPLYHAALLDAAGMCLFSGRAELAHAWFKKYRKVAPADEKADKATGMTAAMIEMFLHAHAGKMLAAREAADRLAALAQGTPHADIATKFAENMPQAHAELVPFQTPGLLVLLHSRQAAARHMLECALTAGEKLHGKKTLEGALLHEQCGQLSLELGEPAAALSHYDAAWISLREAPAPEQSRKSAVLQQLLILRTMKGDWAGVELCARELLELMAPLAGDEDMGTAGLRFQLAGAVGRRGDSEVASARLLDALRTQERSLADVLESGSEQDRLRHQRLLRSQFDLLAMYGSPQAIAGTLLRQKGLLLDSLIEDRQLEMVRDDATAHPLLTALEVAREVLAAKTRAAAAVTPDTPAAQAQALQKDLATAREGVTAAQSALMAHRGTTGSKRRPLDTTLADIREGLPVGAVLLDYYRHREVGGMECYSVVYLTREGQAQRIRLGDAVLIEELLRMYHQMLQRGADDAGARRVLFALGQILVAPVLASLAEPPSTIIVCPEESLSFLSFATLLLEEQGQFLGETHVLRYVSTSRDLALDPPAVTRRRFSQGQFVIFGAPDLQRAAPGTISVPVADLPATLASVRQTLLALDDGFRGFGQSGRALASLAPLPGLGGKAQIFEAADATESRLRATAIRAGVLHLAVPSFYLPAVGRAIDHEGRGETWIVNPLQRSGLLLAGARGTLESWKKGLVPPDVDDGIVTAREAASLDLNRAALVALSSCRTPGRSDVAAGEAMLALRRSLSLAGAANVLVTLWPVENTIASAFMTDFYKKLAAVPDPASALAEVQRDWLARMRTERGSGLAMAASVAGAFVLTQSPRPRPSAPEVNKGQARQE